MTPFLWIATALALGIALAKALPPAPVAWLVFACSAIAFGFLLLRRNRLQLAWGFALASWCLVGVLASTMQRVAVPSDRADLLVDAGRLNLSEPLRWRGQLREDPLRLPWGYRYEIALRQVEVGGKWMPVRGGLRLSLYNDPRRSAAVPAVRAGDSVEALAKARLPRNFGNPGAFDYRGYLERQGIELTGTLRDALLLRRIPGPEPTLRERLARGRGDLLGEADLVFGPRQSPVIRAMLLGDRSFVDSTLATTFQQAGSYHVLVIAGLHVAVLAMFLFWLCRRLRLGLVPTTLVVLAVLVGYVALVQDRPPVELAAVMLLLAQPAELADSSFQLSFLAAAVIAGIGLPWVDRTSSPYRRGVEHLADVTRDGSHAPRITQLRLDLRQLLAWLAAHFPPAWSHRAEMAAEWTLRGGLRLWEVALLSCVIQIGLLPMLVADFHRVSLSGPVANIPAVLLTGLIVPLGFLALTMGLVWTRAGVILAWPVRWLVHALVATVEWFAGWRFLSYRVPGSPVWLLAAFLVLLVLLAVTLRRPGERRSEEHAGADRSPERPLPKWVKWALGTAIALAAVAIAVDPFPPKLHRGEFQVTVLDVGQGDSIFVAFPDGRTLLIDGGGLAGSFVKGGYQSGLDVGEEVVSPYLWSLGLKRIDAVELTHTDHDHMGGLPAVFRNFRVGQFWIGHDAELPAFRRLVAEARSRDVEIVHRRMGDRFQWDGVSGQFLWPPDDSELPKVSNNDSVVLALRDGAARFLFTGDIEKKVEDAMIADGEPLSSTFLKVAHHGSKTSSTQEFLKTVRPSYAVISVGADNPYGHPAAEVVQRYQKDGIALWRTDRDGAVTALTRGHAVAIEPYLRASR